MAVLVEQYLEIKYDITFLDIRRDYYKISYISKV